MSVYWKEDKSIRLDQLRQIAVTLKISVLSVLTPTGNTHCFELEYMKW